jgi:hypothetical protein
MLEETELFVRKAIGWVLREASKKRADAVADWLEPRAARASGVTIREAIKYLPEERQRRILEAHKSGGAVAARPRAVRSAARRRGRRQRPAPGRRPSPYPRTSGLSSSGRNGGLSRS